MIAKTHPRGWAHRYALVLGSRRLVKIGEIDQDVWSMDCQDCGKRVSIAYADMLKQLSNHGTLWEENSNG